MSPKVTNRSNEKTVDGKLLYFATVAFLVIGSLAALVIAQKANARRLKPSAGSGQGSLSVQPERAQDPTRYKRDDGWVARRPRKRGIGLLSRLVMLVIAVGLLLLGLTFLVMSSPFHAAIDSWNYKHWPKADATIVEYKSSTFSRHRGTWRVYRFELGGREQEGRGPRLTAAGGGPDDMPVGMQVTVAYNPRYPEEVLSEADTRSSLLRIDGLLFGAFSMLIGGVFAFAALRTEKAARARRRRRRKPPRI